MTKISDFIETENVFGDIRKYFAYNISQSRADGRILECGVYKGTSVNHIADIVAPKTVYGFDSFEGLPEPWEIGEDNIIDVGCFSTKELPKVRKNVELIEGWFKDTLPEWAGDSPQPTSFLHIDCDIYSSTIDVLKYLNHTFVEGTVIVFDDLYSWTDEDEYPYWRRGQWKALREWLRDYSREIEVVSRMRRRHSGAIRIIK